MEALSYQKGEYIAFSQLPRMTPLSLKKHKSLQSRTKWWWIRRERQSLPSPWIFQAHMDLRRSLWSRPFLLWRSPFQGTLHWLPFFSSSENAMVRIIQHRFLLRFREPSHLKLCLGNQKEVFCDVANNELAKRNTNHWWVYEASVTCNFSLI